MKQKIVGFIEMTKRKGKVVFVLIDNAGEKVVGMTTDKIFLYDEVSEKITKNVIGKEIEVVYGRGYNGNAFVSDVIIK